MSNKIYELDGFPAWIQDDWQKWYDIAKSYERAIKILLDAEVPDRDLYSERDVLPILSMLRHYAELVIKSLLLRNGKDPIGSHNLETLKRRLDTIHPDVFGADSWVFLKFLNGIDTTGGAFRYPVDPSNKPFFTDQTDRHAIDLAYLYPAARQIFLEVSDFVDQHGRA